MYKIGTIVMVASGDLGTVIGYQGEAYLVDVDGHTKCHTDVISEEEYYADMYSDATFDDYYPLT